MSSSVTIDWRALREQERREAVALRSQLAALRRQCKQVELQCKAASAAHGGSEVKIPAVPMVSTQAGVLELRAAVVQAEADLSRAANALDREIQAVTQRLPPMSLPEWSARVDDTGVEVPKALNPIDIATLAQSPRVAGSFQDGLRQQADMLAKAEALVRECQIRCPGADLTDLNVLRDGVQANPSALTAMRYRAAQLIQEAKQRQALAQERERLLVLAEGASPGERAALRRRIADTPIDAIADLAPEVEQAVDRAQALQSRLEAVAAVRTALESLGYTVGPAFDSLLPDRPGEGSRAVATYAVVPSKHSAEHGLRVRVGQDQIYVSVVRKAGTGDAGSAEQDANVQARTCQDLDQVPLLGTAHGMQLMIGNRRAPGQPAPQVPAQLWTSDRLAPTESVNTEGNAVVPDAEAERQRHWEMQEAAKRAASQAQTQRRPE